jgi:copper chaperone CopZ
MDQKTVKILNISCGHCVRTIETELEELEGISEAKADLDHKELSVKWEKPATWQQIKNVLEDINYPPSE